MSKLFKPLLGYSVDDMASLKFPVLASPKLDGIRALNLGDGLVSRNLKPIPNAHAQALFGGKEYEGLDGELIVGDPTATNCYQATSSGVMSRDGEPEVSFYVFDRTDMPEADYCERLLALRGLGKYPKRNTVLVEQVLIIDAESLLDYEEKCLALGYEGIMVRNPDAKYKLGRSTAKAGELGKVKRFVDSEAEIIGFQELTKNTNEKTKDNLGHSERSSHKENMIPMGTLGALLARDLVSGVEFNIGSGFTLVQRQEIWDNRDTWISKIAKYKSFPIGVKDAPRFPIYLGVRDRIDL